MESCIGSGAVCVAYEASEEDGLPVRLKQCCPLGAEDDAELFPLAEERFLRAYRQQIEMMRDEKTSAVTAGLCGLFQDDSGRYWSSVNAMVGRTLDRLLADNSFRRNMEILRRLAESVRAYHEAGWLLLDVKPANILVIDSLGLQGISFFDFDSIVRMQDVEDALRDRRRLLLSSSECYSAPELQERNVDLRELGLTADFYSIGAVLFEALFGRAPEFFDCIPGCSFDYASVREPLRGTLSAELLHTVTDFLHRTLTMSPAGRFENDTDLLAALDRILIMTEATGPQLIRFLPGAVRDFYGREREIAALHAALQDSDLPLYLCGMAGIGKTQLLLRAAEKFSGEYDFYFASFQGSIRKTVLSLPFDRLSREKSDESGAVIPKSDEELWQEVLSSLRKMPRGRSILMIDGFDAANDEDTPGLLYDPDLAALTMLPFRLIFTTRYRFDGVRRIDIESLDSGAVHSLLHSALPTESDDAIRNLAETLGQHTLTLRIFADTVRESNGRLRVGQLLEALSAEGKTSPSDNPVSARLRSVFCASDMSRSAKSVLACASLFPGRGLSSELLLRLFSREQWAAAGQLERSGWLRFDPSGGLWTMHPLVRMICRTERQTRADWENVGTFVASLKKAENNGDFDRVGPEERAQLDELFAAVGKLTLHRKPSVLLLFGLTAAVLLLFAVLFLFREKDESPLMHLDIYPAAANAAPSAFEHDSSLILDRLRTLGFRDAVSDPESGRITASARTSLFGKVSSLHTAAGFLTAWPDRLYAVGKQGLDFSFLPIARDSILDIRAEYGSIPGLSKEQRKLSGLPDVTEYAYLSVRFDRDTSEQLRILADECDSLSFGTDVNPAYTVLYTGRVLFRLSVPGVEENSWYLVDGGWAEKSVCSAIGQIFLQDELISDYDFSIQLEPSALWQDPQKLPSEILVKNQCGIMDLHGDTATMYYRTLYGDSISDAVFGEVMSGFRERLDQFGLPYALGTGYFQDREIAVCISPESLCREIASEILPADRVLITSSADPSLAVASTGNSWSGVCAKTVQTENGNYALQLSAPNSAYLSWLFKDAFEKLTESGGGRLFLCLGSSSRQFLSADPGMQTDDGSILFHQSPVFGLDSFGEADVFLLRLIEQLVNSGAQLSPSMTSEYYLAARDSFLSDGAEFGIQIRTDSVLHEVLQ
ncbi:MAG: hypothetical protein K6C12_04560 [Oscillospiraceae bacterium]|nr:hypothetical protein [Oscillospiraceae bacterium]